MPWIPTTLALSGSETSQEVQTGITRRDVNNRFDIALTPLHSGLKPSS